jgi:hypothetical protein
MPNSEGAYTLNDTAGSLAIDAGDDSRYPGSTDVGVFPSGLSETAKAAINAALEKDLAGDPRRVNVIDMGAYEYP